MATKVINTILNMRDNMSKGLLATATNGAARAVREMQSGSVQRYCIWMLGGALGLVILVFIIC